VTSVDVTAADAVAELDDSLRHDGIELSFAEMKDPVKDKLKRFGLFARFGAQSFYPTVGAAVKAYLRAHPVPYEDWEDEASTTGHARRQLAVAGDARLATRRSPTGMDRRRLGDSAMDLVYHVQVPFTARPKHRRGLISAGPKLDLAPFQRAGRST
jgi:hypothetical protein